MNRVQQRKAILDQRHHMSQASHDAKSGFQFFKKLLGVEERDTRKEKKIAPKEQKNVAKGNLTRLEILPIIQIFYLVLLCSANYNAIYLRNIFPSGIYLNLLEYIFPILLSSKRYSQPMRVRTDNTLHKCHKCTSPLFSANEHSSVLSCVKWVLHYRLSTLLVLLFLQLIQRLTHDDCKRCVGVCWTHDYDYHFGSSNASFKKMEETSGQLGIGEIPWIL